MPHSEAPDARINLRVREETLELARALCEQRGLDRADLLREALDLGLLALAASGPPAEQSAMDTYGTLLGPRLALRLRPRIVPVLDFLSRYDATPLVASRAAAPALSPPPAAQSTRPAHGTIAVDDAVNYALDAFGVGALGNTETLE